MRKTLRTVLLLLIVVSTAVLLTGCKKSESTYFLRGVSSSYEIGYQGDDFKDFVTQDIILQTEYLGTAITWESSHPELVSTTGEVNLPDDNQTVTLTAKFEVDGNHETKTFKLELISKDALDGALFNDAVNKIALFSTRNNEINYENAKLAFEKVDPTSEGYDKLSSDFKTNEQVFEITNLVKAFVELPTTEQSNNIKAKISALPQDIQNNNEYVRNSTNQVNGLEAHLETGDFVKAALDNKTSGDIAEALTKVEAMPASASKVSMKSKLDKANEYYNSYLLLSANDVTQEVLEAQILANSKNNILSQTDLETIKGLYNQNQTRLFDALADKGSSYVNDKITDFHSAPTQDKLLVLLHLGHNYAGLLSDEVKAKVAIVVLSKHITESNLTIALEANELVADATVKASNQAIINEYQTVINIEKEIEELKEITNEAIDFVQFREKIEAVNELGQSLTIDQNITWFEEIIKPFNQFILVLDLSEEILSVPFPYEYSEENETHPLIVKIGEAKVQNNNQVISQYANARRQLLSVIEQNAITRLEELKLVNDEERTEFNRNLFGQILGQISLKDYQVNQLTVYKESLDRQQRLSITGPFVGKIIVIFVAVVVFLVLQAMTADYAAKKGYEDLVYSLISLIPIGGFVYFYFQPKRRNISKSGIKQVYKPGEIFAKFTIYSQIVIVAIIVIIPIIYIFGMALSDLKTDIPAQIWPSKPNFNSFVFLWNETNFRTWWMNTVLIALVNMIIGTVLITGAAYVFARFSFKGKKAGLLTILVLQSFPSFMGLVAMYVLFWKFGLLGHSMALTILYIGGGIPGNIWLIKGFMDQIPRDLDESAMIDGANKLQIFTRIIMPLAIPILTFVAVGMFMAPWMDYMLPGYLLNVPRAGTPADFDITSQWTLAVGLFKFINDPSKLNYSAFAAGALIVGIPITVLYMFFQKYLIEGIMAGATKG